MSTNDARASELYGYASASALDYRKMFSDFDFGKFHRSYQQEQKRQQERAVLAQFMQAHENAVIISDEPASVRGFRIYGGWEDEIKVFSPAPLPVTYPTMIDLTVKLPPCH
jgi:hypothetical protein